MWITATPLSASFDGFGCLCTPQSIEWHAATDDEPAFAALVQRHRRELHVHCYRMLGSFDEAEDLVQETFLRAWRSRESFDEEGGGSAAVAVPDRHQRLPRRDPAQPRRVAVGCGSFAEVPGSSRTRTGCSTRSRRPTTSPTGRVARETIELAFLAVIQLLPPRQRAVLLLRDVLSGRRTRPRRCWRCRCGRPTARCSGPGPPSATTCRRADPVVGGRADRRGARAARGLHRRPRARRPRGRRRARARGHPHHDAAQPMVFDGSTRSPGHRSGARREEAGDWRLVPTRRTVSRPSASYLRALGHREFRAVQVRRVRIEGGGVAEVTTFGPELLPRVRPAADVSTSAPSRSRSGGRSAGPRARQATQAARRPVGFRGRQPWGCSAGAT